MQAATHRARFTFHQPGTQGCYFRRKERIEPLCLLLQDSQPFLLFRQQLTILRQQSFVGSPHITGGTNVSNQIADQVYLRNQGLIRFIFVQPLGSQLVLLLGFRLLSGKVSQLLFTFFHFDRCLLPLACGIQYLLPDFLQSGIQPVCFIKAGTQCLQLLFISSQLCIRLFFGSLQFRQLTGQSGFLPTERLQLTGKLHGQFPATLLLHIRFTDALCLLPLLLNPETRSSLFIRFICRRPLFHRLTQQGEHPLLLVQPLQPRLLPVPLGLLPADDVIQRAVLLHQLFQLFPGQQDHILHLCLQLFIACLRLPPVFIDGCRYA